MNAVVSDTSPINYLIWIGRIELLPKLFEKVLIPPAVSKELRHPSAAQPVREWAGNLPSWASIVAPTYIDESLDLGAGEKEAIALAKEFDLPLLIDELKGRRAARERGIQTMGLLSILREADILHLLDLEQAMTDLSKTNFRIGRAIVDALISESLIRKSGDSTT